MPGGGSEVAVVCAVLLAASAIHASFGFGTALVAMPPLALVADIGTATPLVGLAALTTTIVILARERRGLELRSAWQLIVASLPGIPCGLLLLVLAPAALVKGVLGAVLIAYGGWQVLRPRLPRLRSPGLVYAFGFVAGVLGGAYNTNGPPVVLYGALAGWPAARFRATLQAYFLPTAILICAGHALAGLWTHEVFSLYAWALPALLAGNAAGAWLARRIPVAHFTRALYAALVVLGALMLI